MSSRRNSVIKTVYTCCARPLQTCSTFRQRQKPCVNFLKCDGNFGAVPKSDREQGRSRYTPLHWFEWKPISSAVVAAQPHPVCYQGKPLGHVQLKGDCKREKWWRNHLFSSCRLALFPKYPGLCYWNENDWAFLMKSVCLPVTGPQMRNSQLITCISSWKTAYTKRHCQKSSIKKLCYRSCIC